MTIPPFLNIGDTVAIVAPAGSLASNQIEFAIKQIEAWGLKIKKGTHLLSTFHNFSGTDEQRQNDFQEALNDREIKAIFCARGGYGTIRIVDKINWKPFIQYPKWVIGYSDITVLHSYINNKLKIATIHGPMPLSFEKLKSDPLSLPNLKKILFGEPIEYQLNNQSTQIPDEISGNLFGGNLSLLYALRGTEYDFVSENNILFIEELNEYRYHVDRMIQNFRLGNKFKGLKAIILGDFTDLKENEIPFGFTIDEIMNFGVEDLGIPIIRNLPTGHSFPNYPIILGGKISIIRKNDLVKITFG